MLSTASGYEEADDVPVSVLRWMLEEDDDGLSGFAAGRGYIVDWALTLDAPILRGAAWTIVLARVPARRLDRRDGACLLRSPL